MSFRDDGDAQKHRIDALEDELAEARAEAEELRKERDEALEAPVPQTSFGVGAAVWVEWNHKWWRGTVIRVVGERLWEIHYDGWSSRWDETVGPERIARADRPAPGPTASAPVSAVRVLIVLGLVVVLVAVYVWLDGIM